MTLSRKMLLFLLSGVMMLQAVGFFLLALISQRLYAAFLLLQVEDPAFIWISSGSFLIGLTAVVILAVFLYEMRKEGFTLDVSLK